MQGAKSFVVWKGMVGFFFVDTSKKKEKLRKIKKDFLKGGTHFFTIFYGRAVMSIGIVFTKDLLSLPLCLPRSVIT